MAKPQVQSLDQIMGDLNQVYEPSRQHINKRMDALPGQFDSQRMALDAQKQGKFRDINNMAAGTGQAFSGMPIAEQYRYIGEQYLPGQQRLVEQQNAQTLEMEGLLGELLGNQRSKALDIRGQQKSSLEQFLEAERQRRFQAEQAERDRALKQRLAQQDASLRERLSAAERQDANQGTANMATANNHVLALFRLKKGADGYVSPNAYRDGMRLWTRQGGSPESYHQRWGAYMNPEHQRLFGGYI